MLDRSFLDLPCTTLSSLADVRAVERLGLDRWVPFHRVLDAMAHVTAMHGDRPALCALASADDAAPRRWSHGELLVEIRRSANLFHELAGDEEPRVALLMPSLPETWFALWGAEAAGVACPINPALADAHLVALLNATRANLVVTLAKGHPASEIGDRVLALRARCPALRAVLSVGGAAEGSLDFDRERARRAGDALSFVPPAALDRVAALFHTGGTTGLPKLAQHTERNQLHAAWSAARMYDASEHDVIINGFPLFHVAGAFVYGLSMLLSGAEVLLPPPAGWRDADFVARAWRVMRARGVTILATVPTVMSALLAAPRSAGDTRSLRLALTGGSPLPTELANRFEQETGVAVRNIFGMTECAGVISIEPARAPRTPGSCGFALPFTELQCTADGTLRLRGPNVGPGYTDPHRNVGSFAEGWLITGDIGELDGQGRVHLTGRAKDVIIRGAHNIDPAVIEEALLQHPAVALAAAVGEPDEYAGELPVAFVVAKPGFALREAELLAHAAPYISERAALPKRVECLDALPLTAIGKVYKPALRLRATVRVVRERMERAGLDARVRVQGEDRDGKIVVRFELCGESTLAERTRMEAALREVMGGFALTWELT